MTEELTNQDIDDYLRPGEGGGDGQADEDDLDLDMMQYGSHLDYTGPPEDRQSARVPPEPKRKSSV